MPPSHDVDAEDDGGLRPLEGDPQLRLAAALVLQQLVAEPEMPAGRDGLRRERDERRLLSQLAELFRRRLDQARSEPRVEPQLTEEAEAAFVDDGPAPQQPALLDRIVEVLVGVCNGDALRVSETDSAANREGTAVLQRAPRSSRWKPHWKEAVQPGSWQPQVCALGFGTSKLFRHVESEPTGASVSTPSSEMVMRLG